MTVPAQYSISGRSANAIVGSVERGVVSDALRPGTPLPSTRQLATQLDVSPTTVASAYRLLRERGVVVTHARSRTVIAPRPVLAPRLAPDLRPGVVDLSSGNPDPELLPDLADVLPRVAADHRLYGSPAGLPALLERAAESFAGDGILADHLAVVGGALDGIERVLQIHLRIGDAVAVEDPGYAGCLDLVRTLGLRTVGVPVDDDGLTVDGLADALAQGARAVLHVPRAQNPTGAALTRARASALRHVLAGHPDVLLLEDDHAGPVAGPEARTLVTADRPRWAAVRSLAKSLGPDLRVAVLTGDDDTVRRLVGRQRVGTGWVSHLLQDLTVRLWERSDSDGTLDRARDTYRRRRGALIEALAAHGIAGHGVSGMNVWVPVPEEAPVVQGMLTRGWAVQPGAPFRIDAGPAVRIGVGALLEERARDVAATLADVLSHREDTRRG